MIEALAQPHVQQWIQENSKQDVNRLLLSGNKWGADFPFKAAVHQIEARQKASKKLPYWYANPAILFPPNLSVEQASSPLTAEYKAHILASEGQPIAHIADLTGGMGIDSAALSGKSQHHTYIEAQPLLADLAKHNFKALNLSIEVINCEAEAYLDSLHQQVDWFYIDPARRDNKQRKIVSLNDCQPNVIDLLPKLLNKSSNGVLVKASPMLDIKQACQELQQKVNCIYVVALKQEVKELLLLLKQEACSNPKITAAVLQEHKQTQEFSFTLTDEAQAEVILDVPQHYLYEPHAALFKAGAFKQIAQYYNLAKLHAHSHLYTSQELKHNFIGRIFEVIYTGKGDKKAFAKMLPDGANVSVRNYPEKAEVIAKKYKLKPHSAHTLFATTLANGQSVFIIGRQLTV